MYCFDEGNEIDIAVYDISDPTHPKTIGTFQYSGEAAFNAVPHNGEIRGRYLYVAYYTVGLQVFDVSNPYHPYEVGKIETYRDPSGSGVIAETGSGSAGGWNVSTLFVVKIQISPAIAPDCIYHFSLLDIPVPSKWKHSC